MNVVLVQEVGPLPGEPTLRWVLLTSEPVDSAEQVRHIMKYYELRWRIEEYHKAWKSGVEVERQHLKRPESGADAGNHRAPGRAFAAATRTPARHGRRRSGHRLRYGANTRGMACVVAHPRAVCTARLDTLIVPSLFGHCQAGRVCEQNAQDAQDGTPCGKDGPAQERIQGYRLALQMAAQM